MRKPGKLLSMSYWSGMATAFAMSCAFQDFLGKDGYLEVIQKGWVDYGPYMWIVWVVLAFIATSTHLYIKSLINEAAKEIAEEE